MIPLENLAVGVVEPRSKNKYIFEIYDPKYREEKKLNKGKGREEAYLKSCKKTKEGEGFRLLFQYRMVIGAKINSKKTSDKAITRNTRYEPIVSKRWKHGSMLCRETFIPHQ